MIPASVSSAAQSGSGVSALRDTEGAQGEHRRNRTAQPLRLCVTRFNATTVVDRYLLPDPCACPALGSSRIITRIQHCEAPTIRIPR